MNSTMHRLLNAPNIQRDGVRGSKVLEYAYGFFYTDINAPLLFELNKARMHTVFSVE